MARPKSTSALVDIRLWNRRWPFAKTELRRRMGLENLSQQTFNRALEGAYVSQSAADAIDAAFEMEWFRPLAALDKAIEDASDRRTRFYLRRLKSMLSVDDDEGEGEGAGEAGDVR